MHERVLWKKISLVDDIKHIVWKDQNQTPQNDTKQNKTAKNQPLAGTGHQSEFGVVGHLLNAGFVSLSPLDNDATNATDKQTGSCESTTILSCSLSSDSDYDSVQSLPHSLPPPSPKRTMSLACQGASVAAAAVGLTESKTDNITKEKRSLSLHSCKSLQRKVSSLSYRRLCMLSFGREVLLTHNSLEIDDVTETLTSNIKYLSTNFNKAFFLLNSRYKNIH